ncbi:hypothetical protein BGZ57DRAFT_824038 [Hyaloscypha finlandica]|nr:hypothetical protein BGZ57DRAFT_824038 [Hyaloscypha finlandica]
MNIKREPGRGDVEVLDSRYRAVERKNSTWFWKVGRVFQMLWTEPIGHKLRGDTRENSHISTIWLRDKAFCEIRQFVIVAEGHGVVTCLAIHTYSGQATLKAHLPDPQNHAIIYTSKKCPPEVQKTDEDGTPVFEQLSKDPIRVVSESNDTEGQLSPLSRINYTKLYVVENHIRVLNIGIVHEMSMASLIADSPLRRSLSKSSQNLSRRLRRDRKGKDKSVR